MSTIFCELCSSKASLYCEADDAFLCRNCDKKVHGANFLAFRHVRYLLCSSCQNLTVLYFSGSSFGMVLGAGRRSSHRDSKADEECSRFAKKRTTLSI
ncbi:hypothetical protein AQUCO_01200193v1 [Aquilegia coerulea]|uniref:B box-type domain-containing protein n=1 Tax=Aquilegia coerulea TaxID=218851 RepID=A0A2G5E4U5_AQUCA|nr:hypothetical protein AQUCO_01200193v1 [Aquilegia coerulea]